MSNKNQLFQQALELIVDAVALSTELESRAKSPLCTKAKTIAPYNTSSQDDVALSTIAESITPKSARNPLTSPAIAKPKIDGVEVETSGFCLS